MNSVVLCWFFFFFLNYLTEMWLKREKKERDLWFCDLWIVELGDGL